MVNKIIHSINYLNFKRDKKLKRREFLKLTAMTAGAASVPFVGLTGCKTNSSKSLSSKYEMIPTVCANCIWKCSIIAHVENGTVKKITGNPNDPLCKGRVCAKGKAGSGTLYDKHRLVSPLIRSNNKWQKVSWEIALDHIAEKLTLIKDKYGPESIALFTHGSGSRYFKKLAKAIGTPNIAAPNYAFCRGARDEAFYYTFGETAGARARLDIENAKSLVLIGSHLGENTITTQLREFSAAIANGAEITVVDPRFSNAASKAKWWLQIKPGTDMALILAWINIIINKNLYDKEFVQKYCTGFNELKNHTLNHTKEWAEYETGISAKIIEQTAFSLGKNRPKALVSPGRRVAWYGDDFQRLRAVVILNALLGNWGRKGGFFLDSEPSIEFANIPHPAYPKPTKKMANGSGNDYPCRNAGLMHEIRNSTVTEKPYPIKSWLVYGSNFPQAMPRLQETMKAVNNLDLLVVCDTMPSEAAQLADVILPECTYLERTDDLMVSSYKVPFVTLRQKVIDPMYDTKPAFDIVNQLGLKLGLKNYFNIKDIDENNKLQLSKSGISYEELKKKGLIILPGDPAFIEDGAQLTIEEGQVQLYSEELKELNVDPLPVYTHHPDTPSGMFRLLSGRSPVHTFAMTQTNPLLLTPYPENYLFINNQVCKSLGFKTGDYVVLTNQDEVKSNKIKVYSTERIRTDCVYMTHGFGRTGKMLPDFAKKGASHSYLLSRVTIDKTMGATGMNTNFVSLEKVS